MFNGKKRLGKKVMTVTTLAMSLVLTAPNCAYSVSAAVPSKISITGSKTVFAGAKIDLNLKNKVKGSTYKWSTSDKKVATVNNKGVVTGLKKGKVTITCKITNNKKSETVKATVNVLSAAKSVEINNKIEDIVIGTTYDLNRTLTPGTSKEKTKWTSSDTSIAKPNKKGKFTALKAGTVTITATTTTGKTDTVTIQVEDEITVTNVDELTKALKNSKLAKIVFETTETGALEIPEGSNYKTELVVNAPNMDVVNYTRFKNITIQDIKDTTWTEKTKGNIFVVEDTYASLIVDEKASVSSIEAKGGRLDLIANGTVAKIVVDGGKTLDLKGATKGISLFVNSGNSIITTNVPLLVTANNSSSIIFNHGAEGSTVNNTSDSVATNIQNNTTEEIKVTTDGLKSESVSTPDTSVNTNSSSSNSDSSNSGSNKPETTIKVTKVEVNASASEMDINGTQTITAAVLPANASNKSVKWSITTKDTDATIESNGLSCIFKAGKMAGEVVVTATSVENPSISGSTSITIKIGVDKESANAVMALINGLGENPSREAVEAARNAYNALTDVQKALVSEAYVTKLENAEKAIEDKLEQEIADAVSALIKGLGADPTREEVEAARNAYDSLTSQQKNLVSEEDVKALEDAEAALVKADQDEADKVIALIQGLDADSTKAEVEAARQAYEALTEAQKNLVSADDVKALEDAEEAIAKAEQEKADQDEADKVTALIQGLDADSTRAEVEAARQAYEDLTEAQKNLVSADIVKALEDAEEAIAKVDQDEADKVIALIQGLDADSTKAEVEAARQAYEDLTEAQKNLVSADDVKALEDAEEAIAKAEQEKADQDEADKVTALIQALNADSTRAEVEAARQAYEDLTEAQKNLVSADIVKALEDAEEAIAKADQDEADKVIALIQGLDADSTKAEVEAARQAYEALTEAQKNLVSADDVKALEDAEEAIAKAEQEKADQDEADKVTALIQGLDADSTKAEVEAARQAYEDLTEAQKNLVSADDVKALEDAEEAIAKADQDEADKVIALIQGLDADSTKAEVEAARQAYEDLTEAQKNLVSADDVKALEDAEEAIAKAEQEKADQDEADKVTALIQGLDADSTKAEVEAARQAYEDLTEAQKNLVSADIVKALEDAEEAIAKADQDEADKVIALIQGLDADSTKAEVEAARQAYEALTEAQKNLVSADDVKALEDAEEAIAKAEQEKADQDEADKVTALIQGLDADSTKAEVEAARQAYEALTEAQKNLVSADVVKALEDAEEAIAKAEQEKADQDEADKVTALIQGLDADSTKAEVEAARQAYEALTEAQKNLVSADDVKALEDAEEAIAKAEQEKADQDEADKVTALIQGLDADSTKAEVEAARQAYEDLTEAQKNLVSADDVKALEDAEEAIAKAEQEKADQDEADKVTALIKALDADSTKAEVEAVRQAYEDLTEAQKNLVSADDVKALEDAEEAIAVADQDEADKVIALIKGLDENSSREDVEAVRAAFNELSEEQQGLVPAADVQALEALESALPPVTDDEE